MNKILLDLEKKALADDVAVTVKDKFRNTLANLMQSILNNRPYRADLI